MVTMCWVRLDVNCMPYNSWCLCLIAYYLKYIRHLFLTVAMWCGCPWVQCSACPEHLAIHSRIIYTKTIWIAFLSNYSNKRDIVSTLLFRYLKLCIIFVYNIWETGYIYVPQIFHQLERIVFIILVWLFVTVFPLIRVVHFLIVFQILRPHL